MQKLSIKIIPNNTKLHYKIPICCTAPKALVMKKLTKRNILPFNYLYFVNKAKCYLDKLISDVLLKLPQSKFFETKVSISQV